MIVSKVSDSEPSRMMKQLPEECLSVLLKQPFLHPPQPRSSEESKWGDKIEKSNSCSTQTTYHVTLMSAVIKQHTDLILSFCFVTCCFSDRDQERDSEKETDWTMQDYFSILTQEIYTSIQKCIII